MTKRSQDHEYLQTVPRPVATMAKSYPAGYAGFRHTHARAQFLYAASGSIRLSLDQGRWIIPPRRAVWIPAMHPHQTGSIGAMEMRTLYVSKGLPITSAPDLPRMLDVSPLLHELILRTVGMPIEYDEEGQDGRIISALLGEIDWSPVHPVSLPTLGDDRLLALEQALFKNPENTGNLEHWAKQFGMSPRTLTRLVQRETNLSFQVWRDQIRTFIAIPLLTEGRPLAEIADALGFETAWSFTAMFKRVTGKLPSRYNESSPFA